MASSEDSKVEGAWGRFEAITVNKDTTDVMNKYDEWAKTFDKDYQAVDPSAGGSRLTAEAIASLCGNNKEAYILDLCAGTGLVGIQLKKLGFHNLDALDGSQGMLDEAGKKGIYKKLIKQYLGKEKIPIEDNTYDGMACQDAFYPGHVKDGTCFPELARIVKPGGGIAVVMETEYLPHYETDLKKMVDQGIWKFEAKKCDNVDFKDKQLSLTLIKIIVN